ncbi:alpha/beta hydrolase [Bifidobacterium sp. SO4]|uniref:alpha/beta hydrolase n=1 Tax=Bifidobacterium sp. SO4 TaxID=2809030 RepID=UPI001BDC10F4|nr:alpha/beta hydrolase [Bifidobacterium sp. SO4]MBT1170009.1 alpha/beta hydrolase [Bifidobacterium sp. SO4]
MEPSVEVLSSDSRFTGEIDCTAAVPYHPGRPGLTMDVIGPMLTSVQGGTLPAVLFIQGSGWTTPNRMYAVPRLLKLVARGFVVATVGHTDSQGGRHPFPEYLCDVKSALRYLRLHAERFHIDPERIGIWGTSSGANTALLVGMTQGDARYDDGSNAGASDAVDYVVSCFAPTDAFGLLNGEEPDANPDIIDCVACVAGAANADGVDDETRRRAYAMSPYRIVTPDTDCPPTLLLHGDSDTLVSYAQTEKLYRRMGEQGHDVHMIRVAGGEHEGNFWSEPVTAAIIDFIETHA